jgi:hypothetical protein
MAKAIKRGERSFIESPHDSKNYEALAGCHCTAKPHKLYSGDRMPCQAALPEIAIALNKRDLAPQRNASSPFVQARGLKAY